MALKYNLEYNNVVKIGTKEIKFKPWTTKNEKDYLIAVDGREDDITEDELYNILIKPCLENPDIILGQNEQKILMIEIRKKSIGETFPMRFTCSKCKQVNDIDVSFDSIVNFKPDKFEDVKIEILDFVFDSIPTDNLNNKIKEQKNTIDKSFIEFLVHIKEIEVDGQLENTFSFDELKDFIESLPSYIFDEVYKKFREMKSTLNFDFKTNCILCGEETTIDFEYLPNFLWE